MGSRSKKAAKGIIWSGLERFSTQGAYFVISLILARILAPEDFGVIALTNILIVILQSVNESGFNVALMNKLNRDELDYSSVFIANFVLGYSSL